MEEQKHLLRVGAGCGVILLRGEKILLGKRHDDPEKADSEMHGEGTWTIPGGKMDFGESFEDVAYREVLEETGIKINKRKLQLVSVSSDAVSDAHFITLGFLAEEFEGEARVMESDEITEWRWFEFSELPHPIFSPTERVLRNYLSNVLSQSKFMKPTFRYREGAMNYAVTRRALTVNCVVKTGKKILIVKRNQSMHFYPGLWSGVTGLLDDETNVEKKAREELWEEMGVGSERVISVRRGDVIEAEDPAYNKLWLMHPVCIEIKGESVDPDWEAEEYKWVSREEMKGYDFVPGFEKVIDSFSERAEGVS